MCAGVFVYIYVCLESIFLQLCCDAGLLHVHAGDNCGYIGAEDLVRFDCNNRICTNVHSRRCLTSAQFLLSGGH